MPISSPPAHMDGNMLDNRYAVERVKYVAGLCEVPGCAERAAAWLVGPQWRVCNRHGALYAQRKREQRR